MLITKNDEIFKIEVNGIVEKSYDAVNDIFFLTFKNKKILSQKK